MQDSKLLKYTHFGVRLQERFNIEFTHTIRMELLNSIKTKKAKLMEMHHRNGIKEYTFFTVFRSMRMRFAVSEKGDFITCVRLPENIKGEIK